MKKVLITILFMYTSMANAGHYMLLLSYDHEWIPNWTPHSFAYFYEMDEKNEKIVNDFSISWLPHTSPDDVKVFSKKVRGKNYSLNETLAYVQREKKKLMGNGPWKINESLFELARKQKDLLDSGRVQYKVIGVDRKIENPYYHCVYAISDMLIKNGYMENGLSNTKESMRKVLDHFKDFVVRKVKLPVEVIKNYNLNDFKIDFGE